jgi:PTS system mannose-specific IIA component
MIGVVMVSHGRLADALLETASEIVGPIEGAESLAVARSDRLDEVERALKKAVERADQGDGVLVLADMFGGTAANIALQLVGRHRLEVVTGFNLPMLLKLSTAIDTATDLTSLAQLLKFYGQRNVVVASELLKEREQDG